MMKVCPQHLFYIITVSLFICSLNGTTSKNLVNTLKETRKFFTRSVFDLHIEHLTFNLNTTDDHLNKFFEPAFLDKCYTHIDINQCYVVLGICVAEINYLNKTHQHIPLNRPILMKYHENLIQAYNRTPSFSWEIYNDLLPIGCEIGHEQIMTSVLNMNTSTNRLNLTYNLKLSTMIKHSLKLLFNVYHLTPNGDLWLIDQLSTILSRVELNQPWTLVNLIGSDDNSVLNTYQQSVNETTLSLLSPSYSYFSILVRYRYSCSINYYGEDCNHFCRPRDSSFGHYQCHPQTGELVCNPGWIGARCSQALCRAGCKHGTCIGPELCSCIDGWTGSHCDHYLPFTCECEPGWTGMLCNINMRTCDEHTDICQNRGFYGAHCEKKITDCKFHGCNNRGKCQREGTCVCNATYYGAFCQFNQTTCDQNPCLGSRSKCLKQSNQITDGENRQTKLTVKEFKCQCEQGKFGENCEFDLDECLLKPCQNGGYCVDMPTGYKCVCPPRFTGAKCQISRTVCQNNSCANGGQCLDESVGFQCHCLTGWKGLTCRENVNECSEIPKQTGRPLCQNNAGCRDLLGSYRCLCSSGWEGKHCEIRKSNHTQLHHHSNECIHNKVVSDPIRKNKLYHHYKQFIMLFTILTIAFFIVIIILGGGILFYCSSYKYQRVKMSNNRQTCQSVNTSILKTNKDSALEAVKTNEHRKLTCQSLAYPIHQQKSSNVVKSIHDWPCLLYVNNSFSDKVFMNIQNKSYENYQNHNSLSLYRTPQCYIEENRYVSNNTDVNPFLKSDNTATYCMNNQLSLKLKNCQHYEHHNRQHHHHNLETSTQRSQSLPFVSRPNTPPPTYENSIGLNKIISGDKI
ncbi:unnamed protein product [Heterobilharzia americana]|nr:unnamed protein product [Heterobilharzia americana]